MSAEAKGFAARVEKALAFESKWMDATLKLLGSRTNRWGEQITVSSPRARKQHAGHKRRPSCDDVALPLSCATIWPARARKRERETDMRRLLFFSLYFFFLIAAAGYMYVALYRPYQVFRPAASTLISRTACRSVRVARLLAEKWSGAQRIAFEAFVPFAKAAQARSREYFFDHPLTSLKCLTPSQWPRVHPRNSLSPRASPCSISPDLAANEGFLSRDRFPCRGARSFPHTRSCAPCAVARRIPNSLRRRVFAPLTVKRNDDSNGEAFQTNLDCLPPTDAPARTAPSRMW